MEGAYTGKTPKVLKACEGGAYCLSLEVEVDGLEVLEVVSSRLAAPLGAVLLLQPHISACSHRGSLLDLVVQNVVKADCKLHHAEDLEP